MIDKNRRDHTDPCRQRAFASGLWSWLGLPAALMAIWTAPPAHAKRVAYPGAQWKFRTPEELGMHATELDELAEALGGNGFVVRRGYAVKAWGAASSPVPWLSSSKPVMSTLLFFAIEEGKVSGVDAKVKDWGWDLKGEHEPMTFRHLADMVSGYARPEPPGAAFAYNDYAIRLYCKTLERVFGQSLTEAMRQRLAPLQFEDEPSFPKYVQASVRDFARIGWLWLNKGNWDGRQLLPRKYFTSYMRPDVPKELPETDHSADTDDYLGIGTYGGGSDHFTRYGPGIYGFNWWFNATGRRHPRTRTWPDAPRGAFMSIGAGGNNCVMIPRLKLVLASGRGNWGELDAGDTDSAFNRMIKLLVEACTDSHGQRLCREALSTSQPTRGRLTHVQPGLVDRRVRDQAEARGAA